MGWSLGLAPHLSLLDVNLVSDEHDGDVLADADQVAVPVGHRLVRDARGDVEHDDGALPLDAEDKKKKAPGGTRGACHGPDGVVKTRTQNHSQGTRRRAQAVRRRVGPARVKDGTLRAAESRRRGSARGGVKGGERLAERVGLPMARVVRQCGAACSLPERPVSSSVATP